MSVRPKADAPAKQGHVYSASDLQYGIRLLDHGLAEVPMRVNRTFKVSDSRFQIGAIVVVAVLHSAFPAALRAQNGDIKAASAAIMQADRDFSQSVAARDKKRFLSLISDTAVFVGDRPFHGHDEILKGWGPFFDPNGPTLSWEPTRAEVLVGGDVGVTIGSWVRRAKTPDGTPVEAHGQYVTTWQKQKDGSWKVVYDIGSTAP